MTKEQAIKIIRRYECNSEHYEACEMAIKALEQEPCEDAISRQAVLDLIYNSWAHNGVGENYGELSIDALKALPPVTPAEKVGRWIFVNGYEGILYECTACRDKYTHTTVRWNYCPNCGAKMQEVEE